MKREFIEYAPYGEVVRASVLDIVTDPVYRMVALIKSGQFQDRKTYVAYRSFPNFLNEDIVIRIDFPRKSLTNLGPEDFLKYGDEYYVAYFVSSEAPKDFECAKSSDTLLGGIWQDRMKKGYNVPILEQVAKFYDPGGLISVLHFSIDERGSICPYELLKGDFPIEMRTDYKGEEPQIRDVGNALRRYSIRLRERFKNSPLVITIDEHIDFEKKILPEFKDRRIRKGGIKGYIKMQPQQ